MNLSKFFDLIVSNVNSSLISFSAFLLESHEKKVKIVNKSVIIFMMFILYLTNGYSNWKI